VSITLIPVLSTTQQKVWTEGMDKPVMAQGEASNWRTALGEALSKIELPEPTINDIVKSEEEASEK
jgi:hypothetical protein